jgi:hypothetical protein
MAASTIASPVRGALAGRRCLGGFQGGGSGDADDRGGRAAQAVRQDGRPGRVAEPGQVLAVLGPNGAGKTTFVRTLATLLRPDGGELRVAGHDVRREPAAVRRVI